MKFTAWFFFKGLRQRKNQVAFTILMVMVSVGLLAMVLFVIDSLVPWMGNYARIHGGHQDLSVEARPTCPPGFVNSPAHPYHGSNPASPLHFFNYSTAAEAASRVPEVEVTAPRLYLWADWETGGDNILIADIAWDFQHGIGCTALVGPALVNLSEGLNATSCIMDVHFAQSEFALGDQVFVNVQYYQDVASRNFTIVGFYDSRDGYPYSEDDFPPVVLDIQAFWRQNPAWHDRVNEMLVQFYPRVEYYNFMEYERSVEIITDLGGDVLAELGFAHYELKYPNLKYFDTANQVSAAMTLLSGFGILVTAIFTTVLIYSSLTTAVTERVREFGILRALGGRRKHIFWQMFLSGTFTGGFAVVGGVVGAYFITKHAMLPLVNTFLVDLFELPVPFMVQWSSVTLTLGLGLGLTLFLSIVPAVKTYRWTTVAMITPDRGFENENLFHGLTRRHGRARAPLMGGLLIGLSGIALAVLPQVFLMGDVTYILNVLILLFVVLLVGMIFLAMGVAPALLRGLTRVVSTGARRFQDIIKNGVFRHQRRNKTISVLVILSFGLLVFLLSFFRIFENQAITSAQLECGSDLSVGSWDVERFSLNRRMQQDILNLEGVEATSAMIDDLEGHQRLYSRTNTEDPPALGVHLEDATSGQVITPGIHGVDEHFAQTVFREAIQMATGDFDAAFAQLFLRDELHILVNRRVAQRFNLNLADTIRVIFTRDSRETMVRARVAGIYTAIPGTFEAPGLFEIYQDEGIVLAQSWLVEYLSLSDQETGYVSRILVKIAVDAEPSLVRDRIWACFGPSNAGVSIWNFADEVAETRVLGAMGQVLSFVIFLVVVLMALQGLSMSGYTTFLERQAELRVYRAVGLSINGVRKLLFLELLVILIGNGLLGTGVGYAASLIFSHFTEFLFNTTGSKVPPLGFIGMMFGICVGVLWVQFRRMFKKRMRRAVVSSRWEFPRQEASASLDPARESMGVKQDTHDPGSTELALEGRHGPSGGAPRDSPG